MEDSIYIKPLRHMWDVNTYSHPYLENRWITEATRKDAHGYTVKVERTYDHAPTMHDILDFYLHLASLTKKNGKL